MRPYRIKHQPSGLYYKPFNGLSNLSKAGKVYTTANNPLSYYKGSDTIPIEIRTDTTVYNAYREAFKDFKESAPWKVFKNVPKTEFVIEVL